MLEDIKNTFSGSWLSKIKICISTFVDALNPLNNISSSIGDQWQGDKYNYFSGTIFPSLSNAFSQTKTSMEDFQKALDGLYSDLEGVLSPLISEMDKQSQKCDDIAMWIMEYISKHKGVEGTVLPVGSSYLYEENQKTLDSTSDVEISPNMSDEDKKKINQFIEAYEKEHPDEKTKLDNFFERSKGENGFTEEEIKNIKYLMYNSDEPYHTLLFDNIDQISVVGFYGRGDDPNKSCYYCGTGKIFLGEDHDWNTYGAYHSFFEEIGHAIDDVSVNGADSLVLSEVNCSELQKAIQEDISSNLPKLSEDKARHEVEREISNCKNTPMEIFTKGVNVDKVVNFLTGKERNAILNPNELMVAYFSKDYFSSFNHTVEDVYGAILKQDWGHDWSGEYDQNLVYTELFSQYFANGVTNKEEDSISREYLPKTYEVIDRIVSEHLKNSK